MDGGLSLYLALPFSVIEHRHSCVRRVKRTAQLALCSPILALYRAIVPSPTPVQPVPALPRPSFDFLSHLSLLWLCCSLSERQLGAKIWTRAPH